ncbi:MAG: GxGYxYP family putative glycoside hydrolase, partial [Oceanipulchritudo sp.]
MKTHLFPFSETMKKTITLLFLGLLFAGSLMGRQAYLMEFDNRWNLEDGLPEKAMLISLQGIVNKDGPELYFVYPEEWTWKITPAMRDFFEERHDFEFTKFLGPKGALDHLGSRARGYVVWDEEVRTSLIVAFTVAGIEEAIVVNEDLIPMAEAIGLEKVGDLRGDFR